jgi:hypothetical protein
VAASDHEQTNQPCPLDITQPEALRLKFKSKVYTLSYVGNKQSGASSHTHSCLLIPGPFQGQHTCKLACMLCKALPHSVSRCNCYPCCTQLQPVDTVMHIVSTKVHALLSYSSSLCPPSINASRAEANLTDPTKVGPKPTGEATAPYPISCLRCNPPQLPTPCK